jgi:hypothetical protein
VDVLPLSGASTPPCSRSSPGSARPLGRNGPRLLLLLIACPEPRLGGYELVGAVVNSALRPKDIAQSKTLKKHYLTRIQVKEQKCTDSQLLFKMTARCQAVKEAFSIHPLPQLSFRVLHLVGQVACLHIPRLCMVISQVYIQALSFTYIYKLRYTSPRFIRVFFPHS